VLGVVTTRVALIFGQPRTLYGGSPAGV
jgi:hypothetical protein